MDSVNQIKLEESFNNELKDTKMTNNPNLSRSDIIPGSNTGTNNTIGASNSSSGVTGTPSAIGTNLFDLTENKTLNDDSNKNTGESMMDTDLPGSVDDEEMKRSIYIGNVDYGTKLTELQDLFKSCGSINRITIMNDKRTGMPKGFAYLEFCEPEAVETALKFDGAMFRGRQIKVSTKRKNIPGYNRGRGMGPGGGFRGGMGRGGFRGYSRGGMMSGGPGPNMRGYYGNPYKSYKGGGGVGGYSGNRHIVNPY
ncbi:Sgn1p-like RRM domain-containing protein [Cryptosporidium ubiquitum]|uniref:Sgn1p-like RRM domain-containing protein n=1 Tax=Cryptosporidium ubiquitum TaxID=857276 RepID=A0A1J4MFA5_9CRYT|nr:Sgn1p-like RRM domain-containing protein [Cryptosporidium ubiquitum]OII72938.1 Sgn1p-like RRM domain-containing protein [Cryptosporidium ubiquitum]